jgi:RNA polymerase sigma-70 factor (ECF subfamily)
VWRTARRLGIRDEDVDDVAQEVAMVVMRREPAIQPGKERAFVVSTTVGIAANWRRSRLRRRESLPDFGVGFATEGLLDDTREPEQVKSLERAQGLTLLEACMAEMTEGQRMAFILFELEELSAREIAEQLGVPEAAVVSRVRRAREVFQRFCQRWQLTGPREGSAKEGTHA